jgi:hypothetical protein
MRAEEEPPFLKAKLGKLSPALLRQLKREIITEKEEGKRRTLPGLKGRTNDP